MYEASPVLSVAFPATLTLLAPESAGRKPGPSFRSPMAVSAGFANRASICNLATVPVRLPSAIQRLFGIVSISWQAWLNSARGSGAWRCRADERPLDAALEQQPLAVEGGVPGRISLSPERSPDERKSALPQNSYPVEFFQSDKDFIEFAERHTTSDS